MRARYQQTLAAVLIVFMLGVSAKSVELFRYRYNGEDGADYEAVFETAEQSVGKTVDKEGGRNCDGLDAGFLGRTDGNDRKPETKDYASPALAIPSDGR